MLKFYADESINAESSLMFLSGYLMTEEQFVALDEAVREARGALPYFHMKEGHYHEHPEIYGRLLDLINPRSVLCSISVSIFIEEHERIMSYQLDGRNLSYWMGKPYTYLIGQMMAVCSKQIAMSSYRNELVAYVFEEWARK
jgi:hypothetical protein